MPSPRGNRRWLRPATRHIDIYVRAVGAPPESEAPAAGRRQVNVGRVDLTGLGVVREAHANGSRAAMRGDLEGVTVTERADNPEDLVRRVDGVARPQDGREEEGRRRVLVAECVGDSEARARVREGGRSPRGRSAVVDRRGHAGAGLRVRTAAACQRDGNHERDGPPAHVACTPLRRPRFHARPRRPRTSCAPVYVTGTMHSNCVDAG